MKLIDLLVRELPKIGGWPESYTTQLDIFIKKEKLVWIVNSQYSCFEDWDGNRVERDQYQSALAASQKVEWSVDGLPPVGRECEMQDSKGAWLPVVIIAKNDGFTFGWSYDYRIVLFGDKADEFRPLRSEADNKREEIAVALISYLDMEVDIDNVFKVSDVIGFMDYVASGKVPGVKLED